MAREDLLDLGEREQAPGHLLVVDPPLEQLFGRVAERSVPHVVEEGGGAREPPLAAAGAGGEEPRALGAERVVDPAGEMHGAQHVAEAAVLGAGEDQEREAELVDEAQPLHRPAVDQRRLQRHRHG